MAAAGAEGEHHALPIWLYFQCLPSLVTAISDTSGTLRIAGARKQLFKPRCLVLQATRRQ